MSRPKENRIRMVAHVLSSTARLWRGKANGCTLGRVIDGLMGRHLHKPRHLGVTHRHE